MSRIRIRQTSVLLVLSVAISLADARYRESSPLLHFSNTLFLISLLLLMAGASLWVLQGGMFDGFISSFKRFFERTNKAGMYAAELDRGKEFRGSYRFGLTYPLLLSGGVLFLISYAGSFIAG